MAVRSTNFSFDLSNKQKERSTQPGEGRLTIRSKIGVRHIIIIWIIDKYKFKLYMLAEHTYYNGCIQHTLTHAYKRSAYTRTLIYLHKQNVHRSHLELARKNGMNRGKKKRKPKNGRCIEVKLWPSFSIVHSSGSIPDLFIRFITDAERERASECICHAMHGMLQSMYRMGY